jgi:Zn2+/Cd2+-exporting ATPase
MLNSQSQPSITFLVQGLDCAEEVLLLKRELGPLVGGEDRLSFDILNARMTVAEGPAAETIIQAVARAGLRAEVWREKGGGGTSAAPPRGSSWRAALTAASGGCAALGLLLHAVAAGGLRAALEADHAGHAPPKLAIGLYAVAVAAGIVQVLPKAVRALLRLRADMNLLMTIAVVGAMAICQWFEAATVSFLFSLSLVLESWSVGRARRAVAALLRLAPDTAHVRGADGGESTVPADAVDIGQMFVVKPGERIPLDGLVRGGESDVNQAPITGESLPVPRRAGDTVFAGTVNGRGALEVECQRRAGDTTLAHIIAMVGEAQSKRAPSEAWVERFARVYTPAVMALALLALIVPPLVDWRTWDESIYGALVLLVIACPCALVISTPVSIVAAIASAARNGVLIKGGLHVETPARLRAIAFDKTGTLTIGRPEVVEVRPLSGHDERELLARAAALEARSEHPIAAAVLARARSLDVSIEPAIDMQSLPGKGVSGQVFGRAYWLGSHRYLEETREETPDVHQQIAEMEQAGRSVVAVGNADCGRPVAVAGHRSPDDPHRRQPGDGRSDRPAGRH